MASREVDFQKDGLEMQDLQKAACL